LLRLSPIDKWILAELDETTGQMTECLESLRFFDAASTIYHFFWHSFCDWYLELVKPVLQEGQSLERHDAVCGVLAHTLETSMCLLHPFMPFLTEEIWTRLKELVPKGDKRRSIRGAAFPFFGEATIMLAPWPAPVLDHRFEKEAASVRLFQEAVAGIRDLRSRLGLKPADPLPHVTIVVKSKDAGDTISGFKAQLIHLARLDKLSIQTNVTRLSGMVSRVYAQTEIFVDGLSKEALIEEAKRLRGKITEVERVLHSLEERLADSKFISNAPEEVVEREKERKDQLQAKLDAYRENLSLFH